MPEIRRLDPCPCGSGLRYKDCHGKLAAAPGNTAATLALERKLAQTLALRDQADYAQARELLDAILAEHPREPAAWNNDGLVRMDLLDLSGAIASFERAIEISPGHVGAHFNLALAHLMQGDYGRGWPEYEWRTRAPDYADYANHPFGIPRWKGEALQGKRLLVHAEQGFGDTIQFSRFLALAAQEGAIVDVFCQPSLRSLLARVAGVRHAIGELTERPTHDYHAPLLDLGAHFLPSADTQRWHGPYLGAAPERVHLWANDLSRIAKPRIGVAWSGNVANAAARRRSIAPNLLARALPAGASIVSLQMQPGGGEDFAYRRYLRRGRPDPRLGRHGCGTCKSGRACVHRYCRGASGWRNGQTRALAPALQLRLALGPQRRYHALVSVDAALASGLDERLGFRTWRPARIARPLANPAYGDASPVKAWVSWPGPKPK